MFDFDSRTELQPSSPKHGELSARFMGVSTIALDDGDTAIMMDGFFSRPNVWHCLRITSDFERVDDALEKADIKSLAALLVAHSHHDHAMDSAYVALKKGAVVVGSGSVANIIRGYRSDKGETFPEDRIHEVHSGDVEQFGGFKVTAYESPHSPHGLMPGEIHSPLHSPASVFAFHGGCNFSFLIEHRARSILIHPSANFVAGMFNDVRAEIVFLGVGTLGKRPDEFITQYWDEVVRAPGAKLVVPIHWDNFTVPLDRPLKPMPKLTDDFDRTMEIIGKLAERDQVEVKFMPLFAPVPM